MENTTGTGSKEHGVYTGNFSDKLIICQPK